MSSALTRTETDQALRTHAPHQGLYNSAGALRAYWKSLYSTYPSPKLYLSEFGWGEAYENAKSEIHAIRQDDGRSKYMIDYTSELLLSIHEDGLPWKGFFAWSLLDNW